MTQIESQRIAQQLYASHDLSRKLMRQVIIMRDFIAHEDSDTDIHYLSFLMDIRKRPEYAEFKSEIEADIEELSITEDEIKNEVFIKVKPIPILC
ncbi:hypothetical protein [Peribacillus loiseleuriae]|uniref:hypothetical protein n=1 Tax=Peribacillus loiseleuriae TaxID=1679170 RepID=UPI003CFF902D